MEVSLAEVKIKALIGNEWDPVTYDGNYVGGPFEIDSFEPTCSQGFILLEALVSSPSAEDAIPISAPDISPFPPLMEEFNLSLSAKPTLTFSNCDARAH